MPARSRTGARSRWRQGHGVDTSGQRARKVLQEDFSRFDLILGMDRANVRDLKTLASQAARYRTHLYLDSAAGKAVDVPDPYCDGAEAFASVYRMIREASDALAKRLGASASPTSGQASSTM
ncbi:low molecular weight phosphotyrosine protein phosphatase [Mesorhizobium sp. B2-7-2]|uniref:arsenate reductase/protein-tyrosine-phosphatase family protein n=1 Tax=Mesorhizobium sp. B2-7-2 TaxID=2589908 RepID=UPI0032B27C26